MYVDLLLLRTLGLAYKNVNSCARLSLTPLCYLWQRNQDELLSEMIDSGLEAILIKVAGIGLKTSHLGLSLASMQTTLRRLVS